MTKTQTFQANEAKRDQLRDALPVVMEALDALKDELIFGKANLGVTSDTVGNSFFQQIVGANFLCDGMERLTQVSKAPEAVAGPKVYTDADFEYLKKLQQEDK